PFLLGTGHLGAADLEQYGQQGGGRLQLTQAGLLSYDELLEQSRLFLSKRLIEAVNGGQPARLDRERRDIEPPLTPVPLPRLLHQAARAAAGFGVDAFLDRYGASFPAKSQLYFRRANLLRMGRDEIELLELMKPGLSVRELLAASADRASAASFLNLLIRLGMISLHPAPEPDRSPDFPQKRLFNRPIEEVAQADTETMSFEDLVEEVSDSVELVVGEEGMAAPLSSSEIGFEQDIQRDFAAIQDKNYYEIFSLTQ